MSWEDIRRKYFYASVSWSLKSGVEAIPCSPMDGGPTRIHDQTIRVSVEFDRRFMGAVDLGV
ncbi:hypothetical protein BDV26DRAFT_258830 [Aspergillus bertholletiae]|uniref:Uncharacterized protein n=1 Tax=Aspergillus bertholletiae TaxID=1226010 RepID=A0A5N7BDB7_9EURO|nr:hypothetical protein BDV26DRAFT_258830 [Aspergillus bertholletiae]